jgi:TetR/AcrR family transcriptional repressor of nem operon
MTETAPRQPRAERTRTQILETAALAFAERGFDAVSLNELIRASGVTKGAFYFHFASKDELALATFRTKQQELIALLRADGPSETAGAEDRIASLLRRRAQLLRDNPSLGCVARLGSELNVRSEPGSAYASFQDVALELIAGIVDHGRRTREFRADLDPEATARAIFAWILGLDTLSLLSSRGRDLASRSEEALALLLPALRARDRPRRQPVRPTTDPRPLLERKPPR